MARPLTTREAAELVNCTPQTIARHCALGKYPGAFRFSRRWRIPSEVFRRQTEDAPREGLKTDLSVTEVTQANGKPYGREAIELRRRLRSHW